MSISFKEHTVRDNDTAIIVDALNLAFRWKHQCQVEFIEEYIKTVLSLARSYKAGTIIIAADSGSSRYRKELLPEYKDNRKEQFADQTEEEKLLFQLFFEEFNRLIELYIETDNCPVFRFAKTEADDIAAYIVKNRQKFGLTKIWLISSDRDWDLLVTEGVSRFSYVTRKEITIDNWDQHYEWSQEQHISIKCLQGDAGDNVPGVNKVGPKTAIKLLEEYGTAYDVAANLPLPGKYVYIKNLNNFGSDNILRNYKLMDLLEFCEEALGPENCAIIDKRLTCR